MKKPTRKMNRCPVARSSCFEAGSSATGSAVSAGSVLILVLWSLFFLATLAVAIGTLVSANLSLVGALSSDSAAYYAARAGVERAIAEVMADTNDWDGMVETWYDGGDEFEHSEFGRASFSVLNTMTDNAGVVTTNFGLVDESGRISINRASQSLIEAMLRVAGDVREEDAGAVALAIIDWRDIDDLDGEDDVLTGGSESSYYASLGEPYSCRNGDFRLLEELLLVKGISESVFDRIRPSLTVYGSGKVNINTADRVVLRCIAMRWTDESDTASSLLKKIEAFRESGNVFEPSGESDLVGTLDEFNELNNDERELLAKMEWSVQFKSTFFRGVVEAWTGDRRAADGRIEFVFDKERGEKVYWHEY